VGKALAQLANEVRLVATSRPIIQVDTGNGGLSPQLRTAA